MWGGSAPDTLSARHDWKSSPSPRTRSSARSRSIATSQPYARLPGVDAELPRSPSRPGRTGVRLRYLHPLPCGITHDLEARVVHVATLDDHQTEVERRSPDRLAAGYSPRPYVAVRRVEFHVYGLVRQGESVYLI